MEGDFTISLADGRIEEFQSTPSVWRVTNTLSGALDIEIISIHTLRVEGDTNLGIALNSKAEFQSTPSVWRVTCSFRLLHSNQRFQSTPSVWRVTPSQPAPVRQQPFQSTPSVWRVTSVGSLRFHNVWISIHTLRVEGDLNRMVNNFITAISIHTLRVEGDFGILMSLPFTIYFNPHPPCGG